MSFVDTQVLEEMEKAGKEKLKTESKLRDRRMFALGQFVSNLGFMLVKERDKIRKIEMNTCNFNIFLQKRELLLAGHKILRKIKEEVMKNLDFDESKLTDECLRVSKFTKEVYNKRWGDL